MKGRNNMKRKIFGTILCMMMISSMFGAIASAGDWTQFGHDNQNTRHSDSPLTIEYPEYYQMYELDVSTDDFTTIQEPVISENKMYITYRLYDGANNKVNFACFNTDTGDEIFNYEYSNTNDVYKVYTSPAISIEDDRVLMKIEVKPSGQSKYYKTIIKAYDLDGNEQWEKIIYQNNGIKYMREGSEFIIHDDNAYLFAPIQKTNNDVCLALFKFNLQNGDYEYGIYDTGSNSASQMHSTLVYKYLDSMSPALDENRGMIWHAWQGDLYQFNINNLNFEEKIAHPHSNHKFVATPVIDNDFLYILGWKADNQQSHIYCYDLSDLTNYNWYKSFSALTGTSHTIPVFSVVNDNVIIPCTNCLLIYKDNGNILKSVLNGGRKYSPTVVKDNIYVSNSYGKIYSMDLEGNINWEFDSYPEYTDDHNGYEASKITVDNDGCIYLSHAIYHPCSPSRIVKIGNILPSEKPNKPIGYSLGEKDQLLSFDFTGILTYLYKLMYKIDWGDGTTSGWLGPFDSEENFSLLHKWINDGEYDIRVKSSKQINIKLLQSDWSDPLTITIVDDGYPLTISAYGPYEGYVGDEIQFTGIVIGGEAPYTYHWDFGDGTIVEGTTSDEQNPIHVYYDDSGYGSYDVTFTVTDDEGTIKLSDTEAVIHALLPIKIDLNKPYQSFVYESIEFEADVTGGQSPYTYHWDFGDGLFSDRESPTHTYKESGDYTLTLTVTDNMTNTRNITETVKIRGFDIEDIRGGIGISVDLTNKLLISKTISYTIDIVGGGSLSFSLFNIDTHIDEKINVKSLSTETIKIPTMSIGKATVTVTAKCAGQPEVIKECDAFIFLFYVFIYG